MNLIHSNRKVGALLHGLGVAVRCWYFACQRLVVVVAANLSVYADDNRLGLGLRQRMADINRPVDIVDIRSFSRTPAVSGGQEL